MNELNRWLSTQEVARIVNYHRSFCGVLLLASSLWVPVARAETQVPFSIAQYEIPSGVPSRAPTQYPANVRNEFIAGCRQGMMDTGLSTAQVQQMCQCMLGRLQARYTLAQFNDIERQPNVSQAVEEIVMTCARQVTR